MTRNCGEILIQIIAEGHCYFNRAQLLKGAQKTKRWMNVNIPMKKYEDGNGEKSGTHLTGCSAPPNENPKESKKSEAARRILNADSDAVLKASVRLCSCAAGSPACTGGYNRTPLPTFSQAKTFFRVNASRKSEE